MAKEITLIRLGSLPGFAIYLGIGALLHALFHSATFDWSSAWTWGWLLGWPIMLFVVFWAFILGIACIGVLIAIGIAIMDSDTISRWRTKRMMRRVASDLKKRAGR